MTITKEQYEEALKIIDQYKKEQPDYIDGYTVEFLSDCRIISIAQLAARNRPALIDIIQQP